MRRVIFASQSCFFLFCLVFAFSSSATESKTTAIFQQSPVVDEITIEHSVDELMVGSLTEEEKHWYKKFQNGLLIFDGWKEISKDILTTTPSEKHAYTKQLLKSMGIKIGTEWSKDNSVRKIDTEQLHHWGDRLRSACKKSPQSLLAEVEAIYREVTLLLTRNAHSLADNQQ